MKLSNTLLAALLGTLVTLNAQADTAADDDADYQQAIADWQTVLETHVDDRGRTDFIALAEDPVLLQNYVNTVSNFGPASAPRAFTSREAVLAYHINTYNALAMMGVIDRGIPEDFGSFFKRASFFKFHEIEIDGTTTNLYDYENKVIRPLNEPRIHFVLNCMVRDCPRLPKEAFRAETLEAQLEQATREFINGEKYVQVDNDKEQIRVSAIFDFYTKDFVASGKARDLPDYINRYRTQPLPNSYKVKYLDYDWTINSAGYPRLSGDGGE